MRNSRRWKSISEGRVGGLGKIIKREIKERKAEKDGRGRETDGHIHKGEME